MEASTALAQKPASSIYTNPYTGLCLDNEKGDVLVTSKDNHHWRIDSRALQVASSVFDSLLTDKLLTARDRPPRIPLDEAASNVHAFLYFILRHQLELQHKDRALHGTMGLTLTQTVRLLDKYDCASHLAVAPIYASLVLHWNGNPVEIFLLACEQKWEAIAKQALKEFWRCQVDTLILPDKWSLKNSERLGLRLYRNFVIACSISRIQGGLTGNLAAWAKVSELFKFEPMMVK